MLGRLPDALQKFFGFVGASLTGLTAVFTAAGFLAERARLIMLGLPSTSFDLQQYLETGARFLAFLPIYLGTALLLALANLLNLGLGGILGTSKPPPSSTSSPEALPFPPLPPDSSPSGVVAETLRVQTDTGFSPGAVLWIIGLLVAVGLIVLWRLRPSRLPLDHIPLRSRIASLKTTIKAYGARHRTLLLLLLLFVQFGGACQQARTVRVHDLLFEPAPTQAQGDRPTLLVGTETLSRWIRTGDYEHAVQYIGWLFLITLLTGWALYAVLKGFSYEHARTWERIWVGASLLLFVSQVTLLPINYGVLLSSNRFPSVCALYAAGEQPAAAPPAERLALVHETDRGYYLYARTRRQMWYVPHEHVTAVVFYGMTDVLQPASIARPCP